MPTRGWTEDIIPAALVRPELLRALAVQRRSLLELARRPQVRAIDALELRADGSVRLVRAETGPVTVGRILDAGGGLPWSEARAVLGEVAGALDAARALGLRHPCPSPDRITVTGPTDVVLDGFGVLAELDALLGVPDDPRATPRPAADQGDAGPASDAFALAALLVSLVTAAAPTTAAVADLVAAGVPAVAAEAAGRALSSRPADRPTPAGLLAVWGRAAPEGTELPTPAPVAAEAGPSPHPAVPPRPAMPWAKVGAAVLAGLMAISVGRVVSGDGASASVPGASVTTVATPPSAPPAAPAPVAPAPSTTPPSTVVPPTDVPVGDVPVLPAPVPAPTTAAPAPASTVAEPEAPPAAPTGTSTTAPARRRNRPAAPPSASVGVPTPSVELPGAPPPPAGRVTPETAEVASD